MNKLRIIFSRTIVNNLNVHTISNQENTTVGKKRKDKEDIASSRFVCYT